MAVIDLPVELQPGVASFSLLKSGVQFVSPFNGTLSALDFVAERWTTNFTTPPQPWDVAGALEAFADFMAGGVNYVRLRHPIRPVPRGTMRGSPTLYADATRGANFFQLTGCGANTTLKAGDMVKLTDAEQLFRVARDAQANGSGRMDIYTVNRLRTNVAAGCPVEWNYPKITFACPAMQHEPIFRPGLVDSVSFDLVEVWTPIDQEGTTGDVPNGLLLGSGYLLFDDEGNLVLA